jgi:hypothetical protein
MKNFLDLLFRNKKKRIFDIYLELENEFGEAIQIKM